MTRPLMTLSTLLVSVMLPTHASGQGTTPQAPRVPIGARSRPATRPDTAYLSYRREVFVFPPMRTDPLESPLAREGASGIQPDDIQIEAIVVPKDENDRAFALVRIPTTAARGAPAIVRVGEVLMGAPVTQISSAGITVLVRRAGRKVPLFLPYRSASNP